MNKLIQTNHEFLGLEFDWLGVDKSGYLGYFATAGAGWIPTSALAEPNSRIDIFETVRGLPAVSDIAVNSRNDYDVSDWIVVAKRGIFAFDWNYKRDQYYVLVPPLKPLLLSEIGDQVLREIFSSTLIGESFNSNVTIAGFCVS